MARAGLTAGGKALAVLSTFGRDHAQLTLFQIARRTGLPLLEGPAELCQSQARAARNPRKHPA